MKKYCVVRDGIQESFDSQKEATAWATEHGGKWELFDEDTGYCLQSAEDLEIFKKLEPFF
jgi:hypothetical protein